MATNAPVLIDELFGELIVPTGDERWAVIHTKPRCEKKLADYAMRSGIHYYLPQMDSKRVYNKRTVSFTKPMFPSYLFCVLDFAKKQKLMMTGLTVGFIRVPVQEELLEELVNIRMLRQPKVEIKNALWLSRGLEVEIVRGPLKDVTGIVEDHTKLHEVRLQVNILRQAVLVTVDPSNVKILGDYILEEESL